ncbi:DUF6350 family protein [Gordonia shandongensis]|uniref:cell division protein PerM n=1 Tax=Gordonia shandongensis TaxID=376351 RepID=UPI0006884FE0|nr:DUF6350 family protein [Gordonia shandongensis]
MPAPTSDSLATRLRRVRVARRADAEPRVQATWDVVRVGVTVPTVAWLIIAVAIAVVQLSAGAGLTGLGSATAAGWLAANQTALNLGGVTISVLPLVPTLLVALGTLRVVRRATATAATTGELLRIGGIAVAGPLVATALGLAVIAEGTASGPVGNPNPLGAFVTTLVVHGVAAVIGVIPRIAEPFFEEFAISPTDRVGTRAGTAAFFVLLGGGALAVLASFVIHFRRVGELTDLGHGFDGYLGLTVLSILYLPNVVIGAAAVACGASASLGGTLVDAFSTHAGAMPPLPIAALVPQDDMGAAGALLFIVPVTAGVLIGRVTRSADVLAHLRAVAVAVAVVSGLVVVATGVAGGQVGELGHAGVNAPLSGVFVVASLGVTALVYVGAGWLFGSLRERRGADRGDDDFDLDGLLDGDADLDDDAYTYTDTDTDTGADADADVEGESVDVDGAATTSDADPDDTDTGTGTEDDSGEELDPSGPPGTAADRGTKL